MSVRRPYWAATTIVPLGVFTAALFVGPFLYSVWLSLTDQTFAVAASGTYIGSHNYLFALGHDTAFHSSLRLSAFFTTYCIIPEVIAALVFAEALLLFPRFSRPILPFLALPALLPSVVIALYWKLLLQGEFGPLSYYGARLGVSFFKQSLTNPHWVLPTIAAVDFWQWIGPVTLFFLSVRISQDRSLVEAAWLDGANRFRAFLDVSIRDMATSVAAIALLKAVDTFKEFDKVYVLTGGGPGSSSELSSVYIWRQAFRYWDFGYAAALCLIVYVLLYTFANIAVRTTNARNGILQ